MLANVLIGIGDACLHIEIYNYVGKLYPNDSAPAFAVFKFTRVLREFLNSKKLIFLITKESDEKKKG